MEFQLKAKEARSLSTEVCTTSKMGWEIQWLQRQMSVCRILCFDSMQKRIFEEVSVPKIFTAIYSNQFQHFH